MCWRDEVQTQRHCPFCGRTYHGDLGHRYCPAFRKDPPENKKTGVSKVAASKHQEKKVTSVVP